MENKRTKKAERNGHVEILGIESRAWRDLPTAKKGWGGYHSRKRKLLNLMGLVLFVSVWILLIFSVLKGWK